MASWERIWLNNRYSWDNEFPTEHFQAFVRHHITPSLKHRNRAGLSGSALCLDFGCGSGANLRYAAALGLDVIGVDISATALVEAKLKLQHPTSFSNKPCGEIALYQLTRDDGRRNRKLKNRCLRLIGEKSAGPNTGNLRMLADLTSLDFAVADGVLYYLSEREVREFVFLCSQKLKPGGALRIYTKNVDDETERSPIDGEKDSFIVNVGGEQGLSWFVPHESYWLELLGNFSRVLIGYDRFQYTGGKLNSFLIITAIL